MEWRSIKFVFISLLLSLFLLSSCKVIQNKYIFYPKDETLMKDFYANKVHFIELIQIFKEDSNLRYVDLQKEIIDSDGNKINLFQSRFQEYERLFIKLGVRQIERRRHSQDIHIRVWLIPGPGMGGKFKSYVFTTQPPHKLTTSLDDIYKRGGDTFTFKEIEENWYLYLSMW